MKDVEKGRKKRKPDLVIRWQMYCKWTYTLKFNDVGSSNSKYGYPDEIFAFHRQLAPENIKGDVFDDAYMVALDDLWRAVQMRTV